MAKPSKEQIAAAHGATLRDVIARDLDVLFVGINPSLYSAAAGHHFARPGNRFWRTLHAAGFTDRVYAPEEDEALLGVGLGVTNVVQRATTAASELSPGEYVRGGRVLEGKIAEYRPRIVAFVGIGAYRAAFGKPKATVGEQPETIAGARVWVLPNTSGLNANHQLPDLARAFGALRRAVRGADTLRP
jgi:TDG/mug DNA glycosylase family protein